MTTWRDRGTSVTGVCAYDDEVALAVVAGAHRHGLDVPGDLAVVGVDNSPFAALSTPALTTVEPNSEVLAQHIADTVVRQLDGRADPAPSVPTSTR